MNILIFILSMAIVFTCCFIIYVTPDEPKEIPWDDLPDHEKW